MCSIQGSNPPIETNQPIVVSKATLLLCFPVVLHFQVARDEVLICIFSTILYYAELVDLNDKRIQVHDKLSGTYFAFVTETF